MFQVISFGVIGQAAFETLAFLVYLWQCLPSGLRHSAFHSAVVARIGYMQMVHVLHLCLCFNSAFAVAF
jgi:hypothetical protein